jgi:hypothetical protein
MTDIESFIELVFDICETAWYVGIIILLIIIALNTAHSQESEPLFVADTTIHWHPSARLQAWQDSISALYESEKDSGLDITYFHRGDSIWTDTSSWYKRTISENDIYSGLLIDSTRSKLMSDAIESLSVKDSTIKWPEILKNLVADTLKEEK